MKPIRESARLDWEGKGMEPRLSKALDHASREGFLRELFDNYPEYSTPSLRCVEWRYKEFIFKFIDEDGEKHTIDLKKARKGFDLLVDAVGRGELDGLGLGANFLNDTGLWDSSALDALAQMAIYGEVIYG